MRKFLFFLLALIGTTAKAIPLQAVGSVDCSALTTSYATVVTPPFNTCITLVFNACDKPISVSVDGGTTTFLILNAQESTSVDWCTNGLHIGSGVNIQAKHNGVVPTSGTLRVSFAG